MSYHNQSVARIQNCADEYYSLSDNEPAIIVQDMLADLRHYCDEHGLCLGDLDKVAHEYYQDELAEEKGKDKEPWGILRILKAPCAYGKDIPVESYEEAKDKLRQDNEHTAAILFTKNKFTMWVRERGSRTWRLTHGELRDE